MKPRIFSYIWDRITCDGELIYDDIGQREGLLLAAALTQWSYWESRAKQLEAKQQSLIYQAIELAEQEAQ